VSRVTRHFRGIFVALVALALSAGVVLGWNGPKEAASNGLATAAAASGQTLPARADEQPTAGTDEETETPDANAPETDSADAGSDTHGALVSQAAEMDTPQSFVDAGLNHGAFVSCVARMNHGHEDPNADPNAPPVDPATLTPQDCGYTTQAATTGTKTHGKSAEAKANHANHRGGKGKNHS
jgi:hypothetical protein